MFRHLILFLFLFSSSSRALGRLAPLLCIIRIIPLVSLFLVRSRLTLSSQKAANCSNLGGVHTTGGPFTALCGTIGNTWVDSATGLGGITHRKNQCSITGKMEMYTSLANCTAGTNMVSDGVTVCLHPMFPTFHWCAHLPMRNLFDSRPNGIAYCGSRPNGIAFCPPLVGTNALAFCPPLVGTDAHAFCPPLVDTHCLPHGPTRDATTHTLRRRCRDLLHCRKGAD